MQLYKKLLYLLSSNEKKQGLIIIFMFLIMATLDIIGIASIMPFIYVLTNPDLIQTNSLLNYAFKTSGYFGIETHQQFLFALGILFVSLLIISLTFKAITTYVQTRFTQMRQFSIAKRLVEGYLHQPYSWFLNRNSADLGKSILTEVGIVVNEGVKTMLNLIAQSIVAFALLILIVFSNPKLALIVGFTLSAAFGLIYKFTRSFLHRIGEERARTNQLRFLALSEAFGAIKEIKLGRLESTYIQRFGSAAKILARHNASAKILGDLPRFAVEAIAFGGMIIVVLFFMSQEGNFADIVPIIVLYAFAGYRLMPAIQAIYTELTALRFVGPTLNGIYEDLQSFKKITNNHKEDILPLKKSITLKNIKYSYPNATKTALKNISLDIPAFTTSAIVGATGSGKTTLIDFILGLIESQQGTLKIDNTVIGKHNLKSWQSSIGYVPQQIYLADDTIAGNIAFGLNDSKEINQEAVEKAAKIANLHDFVINELPDKYKTTVGERGVRLSGGQCQRIGIARALYKNPQVLILDEATSALDNLTEQAVMDAVYNLNNNNITIIMIAHRLTTVKECDIIFLLENGELKAQGSFDKLIETNNKFRATASKIQK